MISNEKPAADQDVVRHLADKRPRAAVSSGGGGGSDDMERRITALEDAHRLIVGKLGEIAASIQDLRLENEKRFGSIEGRLTGIETMLEAKAAKSDLTPIEAKLGAVDGMVRNLPGTPTLVTLIISTVSLCLGGTAGLALALARYLHP